MRHEVRFSGFGGQGIILSAVILGRAAVMYDGKYAVQTQVYGPEARGGASMSALIIDDEPILFPKVTVPDIYVIMSQEGFEKYGASAQEGAIMILDSTLVHSRPACTFIEVPATKEAREKLGRDIVANILMLGALVAATHVVSEKAIESAILDSVPKGTEKLNLSAMSRGFELIKERRTVTMKILEYEAKKVLEESGITIPKSVLIRTPDELEAHLPSLPENLVLKAQVDVGGRGKAGGILMADKANAVKTAKELFSREIKHIPVKEVLVEERLDIGHEYYLSVAVDRSTKRSLILFADAGGVEIEKVAKENPDAVRRASLPLIMHDVPQFMVRDLLGRAPKELGPVINQLYHVFQKKDALLAEINPLVTTPGGVVAADAKLIVDDNALKRQGITVNRDLTEREREAERHGFSYVELEGTIGVIGNGAGLTMATLDLIEYYGGRAANFLDVGGGAEQERVMNAVRLVASVPSVKTIVVNLLGGITRCDEVAKGIISAGISQPVIVRLAGTNEAEGRKLLSDKGYLMPDTMEQVVKAAVEMTR